MRALTLLFIPIFLFQNVLFAQTSWKKVQENKQGTIKVYYHQSEGFIEKTTDGFEGIEYDLIIDFTEFLRQTHKVDLDLDFIEINDFSELYNKGKIGKSGEFFTASLSITPKRLKEVAFSPPYMLDIEVMICSDDLPVVYDTTSFIENFSNARGIVLKHSTYETNLKQIKENYLPDLQIDYVPTYEELRTKIASENSVFSYTQLVGYLLRKQKGVSFRRQNVFKVTRTGQGIMFSKSSDWSEPVKEYFTSQRFTSTITDVLKKYLGDDISDFITSTNIDQGSVSDREKRLLAAEKEIQLDELRKKELEIAEKNKQIILAIVGLVIVSLIISFLINRYRIKQKNNRSLQAKNDQIQIQKNELLAIKDKLQATNESMQESIRYAQSIQQSMLPNEDKLKEFLGEHFIIYLPKDIVSGDFYWVDRVGDTLIVVLVDCTGHGVPGALMTMIAYASLNEIILEKKELNPAAILESLDMEILNTFQHEKQLHARLGMDISICSIKNVNESLKVLFAGAKQTLYSFEKDAGKIKKYDGVRRSITGSQFYKNPKPFINHEVTVRKGDSIYLTSDGFTDSPDPSRKKFGKSRFQQMLNNGAVFQMDQQYNSYLKEMEEFMNGEEQRDDVVFIGLKMT